MALHVEIELLTGRYVAARFNDRTRAEWPPHPARWFSAAVAAWADGPERSEAEADALRWLERQKAPTIACSTGDQIGCGEGATAFVPVNDAAAVRSVDRTYATMLHARAAVAEEEPERTARAQRQLARAREKAEEGATTASQAACVKVPAGSALAVLPDVRGKQPRTFPSVRPDSPIVTFGWTEADPEPAVREVLDRLVGRIGRLGHSSSLVSCRLTDTPAAHPWLVPDANGDLILRTPGPGQFDLLEEDFQRHQGHEPRALPSAPQPYATPQPPTDDVPGSVFASRLLLLELTGTQAPAVTAALSLARALRTALLDHAGEDAPELLSGRSADGTPSRRPHLALVPLPFVGHEHADGLIKGVGLLLPAEQDGERDETLGLIWRWLEATDGRLRVGGREVRLARGEGSSRLATLSSRRWCREARAWATVTPIALDRWPGDQNDPDPARRTAARERAAETVARACAHMGLPTPAAVEVQPDSWIAGVPPAHRFPAFTTPNGGPRRAAVHAVIRFAGPVRGPIVLGAGRYVGQGLCLPLPEPEDPPR